MPLRVSKPNLEGTFPRERTKANNKMGSKGPSIHLQPDALYLLITKARPPTTQGDALPTQQACHHEFEWGLYWCKSTRVGQSSRYKKRDDTWQFEQRWFPSEDYPDQTPIEDNENIVCALQIENMHENMASLLGERLAADQFHHSQPFRASSPSGDRSQKWVSHALDLLNETGFISVKSGAYGIEMIQTEALEISRKNITTKPLTRTVARSSCVLFDVKET